MTLLGFLVAVTFWPGLAGAAQASRWTLLYIAVPIALCFVRAKPAPAHWLMLAALLWMAVTLLWTPVAYDGIAELADMATLAGLFIIGHQTESLAPMFRGLGVGLWVSSAICIAQWFGLAPVVIVAAGAPPSGLFVNPNVLGEICALAIVGLLSIPSTRGQRAHGAGNRSSVTAGKDRHPYLNYAIAGGILPALVLSQSRGAAVALAVCGVAWAWKRFRLGTIIVVPILAALAFAVSPAKWLNSDTGQIRVDQWRDTVDGLTWLGNGIGSYYSTYPRDATRLDTGKIQPNHAHNDALELAFETGPAGCALAFAFLALVWWSAPEGGRLVLLALGIIAMLAFPLHTPATAFVFGLVAGHGARRRGRVWVDPIRGGFALYQGSKSAPNGRAGDRSGLVPVLARIPNRPRKAGDS
jgi:O-antigen ligase